MKKAFKIIKVDKYAVVLLNSGSRITDVLNDVEINIKKKRNFSNVIFDLLLSNGIGNRFFEIPFTNDKFEVNKIKKVEQPENKVLLKANSYYLENISFLDTAVLTRLEKNIIRTNLIQK